MRRHTQKHNGRSTRMTCISSKTFSVWNIKICFKKKISYKLPLTDDKPQDTEHPLSEKKIDDKKIEKINGVRLIKKKVTIILIISVLIAFVLIGLSVGLYLIH